MPSIGQLFTSGQWLVKEGMESDFIQAWSDFARWSSKNQKGAGPAHLLQDQANPRSFLSFGPWDSEAAIQSWRQTPEFQSFLQKARGLCDDLQPKTLALVALTGQP